MGEPLQNGVYDKNDAQPVTRPDLRALEGGGETSTPQQGHLRPIGGDEERQSPEGKPNLRLIRDDEESGGSKTGAQTSPSQTPEPKLADKPSSEPPAKKTLRGRITKKRAGIIGVLTGGLIGGGMFGFSIIQGPMQLVHLGQVLGTFSLRSEEDTNIRVTAWYRFARSGEFAETRVGILGSKLFNHRRAELKKMGIEIQTDRLGNPKTMTFDTSELSKEKIPSIKGVDIETSKAMIAKEFGVSVDEIERVGMGSSNDGHKFAIKTRGKSISVLRGTMGDIFHNPAKTGIKGTIYNSMTKRAMKKFYNLPSLFSPLKKGTAKVSQSYGKRLDKKDRAKQEKERQERVAKGAENINPGAKAKLKEKLSGNLGKVAGGALVTSSGVCFVRGIAEDVVEANRAAIVVPSTLAAVDKTAAASQVQDNSADMDAVAGVTESFVDKDGKTIWNSTALNSISNPNFKFDPNKTDPNDLAPEYKQAFSNKTTSADIKNTLDTGGASDILCSAPGQVIQFVGGLALIAAGPFTAGGSWAAFAAKTGASVAATAAAFHFIEKFAVDILSTDATVPTPMAGPVGGSLIAYGEREGVAIIGRSNGGIELSEKESNEIDSNQPIVARADFKNKSLATQFFDINDYRSVTAQVASSLSPSMAQNMSNIGSSLLNVGHNFSSVFSVFTPKTSADSRADYQWDFPRYGIPRKILTDSKYENPYTNAGLVAELYDTAVIGDKYIDKAKTCFGVSIAKGSNGAWSVVPENEVNPNAEKYVDAKCNDTGDELWIRTMLFVFDTRHMEAAACFELDDAEACENTQSSDSGESASTETTGSETAGAEIVGDPFKTSVDIACAEGTKDVGIHDAYNNGEKIKMRMCAVSNLPCSNEECVELGSGKAIVNSRVSGAMYAMVEAAKKDGVNLNASSSFRTMAHQQSLCPCDGVSVARPGFSNHQSGTAIDFANAGNQKIPGASCSNRARGTGQAGWDWLFKNAHKFGYKQYAAESWHWDPMDAANRCGGG